MPRQCELMMQSRAAVTHPGLILILMPRDARTQTSPRLAAFRCCRQEVDVWSRGQDGSTKWKLGALPGIKLMNLTAASGHHDTNTAWVGPMWKLLCRVHQGVCVRWSPLRVSCFGNFCVRLRVSVRHAHPRCGHGARTCPESDAAMRGLSSSST
ncbi:unnamed protein product [Pleuronectes platessa]|uniref:Uncharacterized protein n=1 Tax=Pleuronectes platessa TaxID=8262 RepID=A0A9N7UW57_PLEPL|nr:unnamed protein product [Pleuronectes platessa]